MHKFSLKKRIESVLLYLEQNKYRIEFLQFTKEKNENKIHVKTFHYRDFLL